MRLPRLRVLPNPTDFYGWNVGPRPAGPQATAVLVTEVAARMTPRRVLFLFEARRFLPALRAAFGATHRVICRDSDTIALVPRILPKPIVRVLRHDKPWVGPKQGIHKRGRAFLELTWPDTIRVLALHRTPLNGGRNAAARAAEHLLIKASASTVLPWAGIGDWNAEPHQIRAEFPDLSVTATKSKVDHVATTRGITVAAKRGDKGRSDHAPQRIRLTRKETRP